MSGIVACDETHILLDVGVAIVDRRLDRPTNELMGSVGRVRDMTTAFSCLTDFTNRSIPRDITDTADIGVLAPVIAGARARGLADAFELMGTAAIMLNEVGTVLHVGARARAFLGDAVCLASDHLVAETSTANRDLERLIAGAVSGLRDLQPILVPRAGATAIEIRAICLADAVNDPVQLLKAILVLREVPVSGRAGDPASRTVGEMISRA